MTAKKETAETAEDTKTTETEATKDKALPKGISQEVYDNAKFIINSGFENGADPDKIKSALFEAGVKFSQLVRLYRAITINEGLVRAPADIRTDIVKALKKADPNYDGVEKFSDLEVYIADCVKTIKGASEKMVINIIRRTMEVMDLEMPKKPKTKKGKSGSKINSAILAFFSEKVDATKDEFVAMVKELTTEKSLKKYVRQYEFFSALRNGRATLDTPVKTEETEETK